MSDYKETVLAKAGLVSNNTILHYLVKIKNMADANYKLSIGPFIDTIYVLEVGGKFADVDKSEDTLSDIYYNETGIRVRLEVGGVEMQEWTLEVTVVDNGKTFKTIPVQIKGRVGRGGGSIFDRTCPLVQ